MIIDTKISDVCDVNPKIPDRESLDDKLLVSFIPMKSVEEESGKVAVNDEREYGKVKKGYTGFIDEDVLFAKITPCMENGKIAIVNGLRNGIGFGSTEFHVLRCKNGVFNKFLFYYLVQKNYRLTAERYMTGAVGQRRVPKQYLSESEIALPPLPEQHRIVAKIEELFSELDAGVESLKKAKEQLKTYRQAVLKAAFEGKLTGEWRLNQPVKNGGEDLQKILEKRERDYDSLAEKILSVGRKKPKRLDTSIVEKDVQLPKIPNNWIWCRIGDVFSDLTDYHANGSYEILKENVELLDHPDYAIMLRSTNLEKSDYQKNLKYITKNAYEFLSKSKLYGDEIIIGKIGNAGKIYYMPTLNRPVSLAMNLFCLRFKYVNSKYMFYHLITPFSEKDIRSYVKGVGNITIDKKSIRSLFIALAPHEEQAQVVQEIESRLSVCDNIDQTIGQELKQSESLRQSILKRAFEGRLV